MVAHQRPEILPPSAIDTVVVLQSLAVRLYTTIFGQVNFYQAMQVHGWGKQSLDVIEGSDLGEHSCHKRPEIVPLLNLRSHTLWLL